MSVSDRVTKMRLLLAIVNDLSPSLANQMKEIWDQERNWGSEGWQELHRLRKQNGKKTPA